ncbi:hypothetical protein QQ045_013522 [Rhodiola kirilowii]
MREYQISKEISLLMQGELTVSSYFNMLLQLWGDEDSYEDHVLCELGEKCKSTKCMQDKKLKTRIQKFFMGLNDVHSQVWAQILATRPRLGLDETYALVMDDETQKMLIKPIVMEASALYAASNSQNDRPFNSSSERKQHNSHDRFFSNNNKAYNIGASPNNKIKMRRTLVST